MIDWARPGQLVVCIEDNWKYHDLVVKYGLTLPHKGCIYTIRLADAGFKTDTIYLWFEEIINPMVTLRTLGVTGEPGFLVYQFRPVRRTDISVFKGLLSPTPTKKLEQV